MAGSLCIAYGFSLQPYGPQTREYIDSRWLVLSALSGENSIVMEFSVKLDAGVYVGGGGGP